MLKWYKINKRNLPWRETTNPYKIWLSEIILQQTRVKQGTPYYLNFLRNYPSLKDLAKAEVKAEVTEAKVDEEKAEVKEEEVAEEKVEENVEEKVAEEVKA